MSPTARHVTATALVLLLGAAAAGAAFVWSGVYDIGADARHTAPAHAVLETWRERSIQVRARALQVPGDLGDAARIVQGAGNYAAMCAQCHLAPGMEPTELSRGLYPEPPDLTQHKVEPAHAFWTIKHGIKASAMPAWGRSMADAYIWDMAAFLQRLPGLDQAAYERLVEASAGHSHGGAASGGDLHDARTQRRHEGGEAGVHAHDAAGADDHDAKEKADSGPAAPSPGAAAATSRPSTAVHRNDGHKH